MSVTTGRELRKDWLAAQGRYHRRIKGLRHVRRVLRKLVTRIIGHTANAEPSVAHGLCSKDRVPMSAPRNPAIAARPRKPSADSSAAVDAFMVDLDHPYKAGIEALRRIILGADARIAEGIKWKAPSFRTVEYFATMHLRAKSGIALILHFGAKVRQLPEADMVINDPAGLLKWLAPDRAIVEFENLDAVVARQSALSQLVRQWLSVHER